MAVPVPSCMSPRLQPGRSRANITRHVRPQWREAAQPIVFLWPQDLKPDPKNNANLLLAFHQGGLFNKFGRVWVCWGDLRTEHLRESELRVRLRN